MSADVPRAGQPPEEILAEFARDIEPYPFGNGHPRFYGWVNSLPSVMGIFAEALAAAMHPSVGYLTEREARGYVEQVNDCLGGVITDYRLCMHHPEAGCSCRKPRPGMVLDLARHYGIDLTRAMLVGDTESDARRAHAAGVGRFVWADAFFRRDT